MSPLDPARITRNVVENQEDGRSPALPGRAATASQPSPERVSGIAGIPNAATPLGRLRKIMRRFRDRDERSDERGPWHGLSEISRAHGSTKDEVRGLLIELVAKGEVEASECANGVFWCEYRPAPPPRAPGPKVFVLQRELDRDQWFDAETFETQQEASARLEYRRWEALARIHGRGGHGYTGEHPQRMRVIRLLASGIEAATADETALAGSAEGESPIGDSRDAQGERP